MVLPPRQRCVSAARSAAFFLGCTLLLVRACVRVCAVSLSHAHSSSTHTHTPASAHHPALSLSLTHTHTRLPGPKIRCFDERKDVNIPTPNIHFPRTPYAPSLTAPPSPLTAPQRSLLMFYAGWNYGAQRSANAAAANAAAATQPSSQAAKHHAHLHLPTPSLSLFFFPSLLLSACLQQAFVWSWLVSINTIRRY